jgi:hypothetical protein
MKKVTFLKNSLFGNKGESREVSSAAAYQYEKLGLIAKESKPEAKEEKEAIETKEEKHKPETKEVKHPKFKAKEVKLTKSPKPL